MAMSVTRGVMGLILAAAFLSPTLDAAETSTTPEALGLGESTRRAGTDWWSLQPVVRPQPPEVRQATWKRNPIDAFVLARLEASGLEPAAQAEPRVLARRLSFDLLGLPPDPARVESFVQSAAQDFPAALASFVEELLSSPHYGERWARHWLDVARYGESDGFEYDQLRPNAWRYRDWVIQALNADMPYDRFVQWQIAGDVLEPTNADAVVATGFLVCGAFDGLVPQGDKMKKIMREDEMEDLVGTVAQTFLGLTAHCARCHDHKFDPISQKDYYQLASALAGVKRGDRTLPGSGDIEAMQVRVRELTKRIADLEEPIKSAIASEPDSGRSANGTAPVPLAQWSFDLGFQDEIGLLHGEPMGGARIENGALRLEGKDDYASTVLLKSALKEKTLEAWVRLENLDQRGGAVVSLQSVDGGRFDAVVFGEREPGRWMAGSEGFIRTQSFGGSEEKEALSGFVHVAIVYEPDGSIRGYRNGLPYGNAYQTSGPVEFPAGTTQVLFGLRHGTGPAPGRMLAGWIDRVNLYDRALTPEEVARSAKRRVASAEEIAQRLSPDQRQARAQYQEEAARLKETVAKREAHKSYAVTPQVAPVVRLLARGNPFQPQDEVVPGGVASIRGVSPAFLLPIDAPDAQRRKKLAAWVTDSDNPLFARVMVNRLWHYHFGQGLVRTPNDFGFNGGEPAHPALLEWLAAEFRAGGWSLKHMHRLIVTSATYMQSASANPKAMELDADNRLLWRHTPWRLEAELVRDAVLAVSGVLEPTVGGLGFQDFHMYNHKSSWVYDAIDPEGPGYNRRSIYRTWARGSHHPLLTSFDCPDPSATAPVRGVTTTPIGALSLFNTAMILRLADRFAQRLQTDAGADPERQIARAYALVFNRKPDPEESTAAVAFVQRNGLPALCRVLFNTSEFLYVD